MCCCPRAGSFCEIFGALTLRFMVDITVSCFLCTRVSEKLRMCMAPFLTPSPRDTNLHESFGLLNFYSLSCCSLPVAYWGILKWATLYWNAILCGLAAISTSQWSATILVELIFQRLHLISSLMPDKSNKTLFDSSKAIQLPIQDRSLHHSNSFDLFGRALPTVIIFFFELA